MNSKQWRAQGYRTIFRGGLIFLFRPSTSGAVVADLAKGAWMRFDDLAAARWCAATARELAEIRAIVPSCYCDQGVDTCDFCSGLRVPPLSQAASSAAVR
jgi:hypothetical protein